VSAGRDAVRVAGAPARLLLIALIRVYRATLSGVLGGQCRFYPSCSSYALDAIRLHGAVKGTLLTVWRIARCGPFTDGGVDPVPPVNPPRPGENGARYDGVIRTTLVHEVHMPRHGDR
jgi:putative membrane protein insertion efficiency factor